MLSLILSSLLLPYSSTGSLTMSSFFNGSLTYLLHPVALLTLLLSPAAAAHSCAGNLLVCIVFAGAQPGSSAPVAAALAWLFFTLHHSLVQGACLALPLARWLWHTQATAGRQGGPGLRARWEVALLLQLALALWLGGSLAAGAPPLLRLAPALLQPALADPTSLAPELSLYWYLLTSAFLRALPYFSTLVWGLPLALTPPILLRCWAAPSLAATLALAVGALLDPSPGHTLLRLPLLTALAAAAGDGSAAQAMGPRKSLLWGGLQLFALAAAAPMKHLWLASGVGNANFLFWQQLIFTLACASLLGEWARVSLSQGSSSSSSSSSSKVVAGEDASKVKSE